MSRNGDDHARVTEAAEHIAQSLRGPRSKLLRGCDPSNGEQDYTDEEREFLLAVDRYKRRYHRPFPTWREILALLKALGYRRESVNADVHTT